MLGWLWVKRERLTPARAVLILRHDVIVRVGRQIPVNRVIDLVRPECPLERSRGPADVTAESAQRIVSGLIRSGRERRC
jgi:hypothetical protein